MMVSFTTQLRVTWDSIRCCLLCVFCGHLLKGVTQPVWVAPLFSGGGRVPELCRSGKPELRMGKYICCTELFQVPSCPESPQLETSLELEDQISLFLYQVAFCQGFFFF